MIIITGASQGIGRYLFLRFKSDGLDVMGTYNSSTSGLEEDIDFYHKVDISDFDQVRRWVEHISNKIDNIVLINCAGIIYTSFAHKSDVNIWKRVIDVNLTGTFYVIRSLLPIMREQRYGRIINFSSVVTKHATPGSSAYAASKAGLIGMTKSLAVENGACGVTANTINLGYVNLGMGIYSVSDNYRDKILGNIPSGRFCEPEEVYNTVLYLINNEYVNGANIEIDGGL